MMLLHLRDAYGTVQHMHGAFRPICGNPHVKDSNYFVDTYHYIVSHSVYPDHFERQEFRLCKVCRRVAYDSTGKLR